MCCSRSCATPPMPWPARWPRHPTADCPAHDPGSTTPTSPPMPPPSPYWRHRASVGCRRRAGGARAGAADCGHDAHGPWDYLGGALVCREAGAVVTDAHGRDLVVLDHLARRTPVAAATPALHAALATARSTFR